MSNNNSGKVNCLKCRHYAITWNSETPKACKLLGFKSAAMPSAVVYESTGKICEGFEPKVAKKANERNNEDSSSDQGVIVSFSSNKVRK